MKTNDPLGDLIDNLIDVYVDNKTPKGVTKQLEPIINGLVELLQGEAQGSPLLDTKMLMELYYTEQFIKAMDFWLRTLTFLIFVKRTGLPF